MNWKPVSKFCISSEEGYLIRKYALEIGHAYVCRRPKGKILHSGKELEKAKAACAEHLNNQKVAA